MSNLKENILKLRAEGKTYWEIQTILKCSKGTIHYHLAEGAKIKSFRRRKVNYSKNLLSLKSEHGGKCAICGYHRCMNALEFHHKDPSTKNRIYKGVSHALNTCSIEKAREEAAKCILICANCHREVHDGLATLP